MSKAKPISNRRFWLAIVLGALALTGCGRERSGRTASTAPNDVLSQGDRHLSHWTIRRHARAMGEVFARADTMELRGVEWRKGPHLAEKIGEIRKADDPARWHSITDAVAQATHGEVAKAGWMLAFVLRNGEKEVALGFCFPGDGELAMRIEGKKYGRVWAGEAFREALAPYEKQYLDTLLQSHQRAGKVRKAPAPTPPIEFPVLKARVLELFETADYANLAKTNWPQGVDGVEPLGKHAKAWKLMTQGVREATEGYALSKWPPEIWIYPLPRKMPAWAKAYNFELLYTNGILYSEHEDLGGMIRTIKPSRKFADGLNMLVDALEPTARGKINAPKPNERNNDDGRK